MICPECGSDDLKSYDDGEGYTPNILCNNCGNWIQWNVSFSRLMILYKRIVIPAIMMKRLVPIAENMMIID